MTQCERSGMKSINIEMLMGHNIGVSGHYYRPAEADILEDYMTHAVDALTIDPNQKLQKQVQELQGQHTQKIIQLKQRDTQRSQELEKLKTRIEHMDEYIQRYHEAFNLGDPDAKYDSSTFNEESDED